MKSFISTDRDTILECLQGEKLLNIVPDGLGNVSLVFESANPDASDLLTSNLMARSSQRCFMTRKKPPV